LYQVENCSLALTAFVYICKRDRLAFEEKHIRNIFSTFLFPGRMQVLSLQNKKLILDGAHNPQKMRSFIFSLKKTFPGEKFDFLIAFKKGKESKTIIKILAPLAASITITDIFSRQKELYFFSKETKETLKEINQLGLNGTIIENSKNALATVLKTKKNNIVVTGSLYLVGEVYKELIN
jgi:dihydrofolate synthase/folylpolyglutamate synthase